jgi:hypothetical protein
MSIFFRRQPPGTENNSASHQHSHKDKRISDVPSHVRPRLTALGTTALITLLFISACGRAPESQPSTSGAGEWHEFQGTWISTGNRNVIRLGDDRRAAIATFTGSLLLSGPSRPAVGFRAEAIAFNDTTTGMIGRAVWTDEHGDKAFSELRGEGTAANNKIEGTFVGGTGRYAGITGTYEFSWRYQIENEDGNVQGESIGLHGRVRVDTSRATLIQGEPQS